MNYDDITLRKIINNKSILNAYYFQLYCDQDLNYNTGEKRER